MLGDRHVKRGRDVLTYGIRVFAGSVLKVLQEGHRSPWGVLVMMIAVIMMFGFVLGIACVIYGGFAIRRGDVDQGKMSIIGGAIIAAAPAVIFAFFKIFGLDSNSAVGVGTF